MENNPIMNLDFLNTKINMVFLRKNIPLYMLVFSFYLLLYSAWVSWPFIFSISDAVAQFFPVSYSNINTYSYFELPLYNWHQHLGIPLLGTGYYPVSDPLFLISSVFAKFIFHDDQATWNIVCSLHIFMAGIAAYYYFYKVWNLNAILAVTASISWAFSGVAIYMGGEWLYILPTFSYIPLILLCIDKWIVTRATIYSVFVSVLFLFFLISSNIQFVFYSLHFILLLFFASPNCNRSRLYSIKYPQYLGFSFMVLGLSLGYIYLLLMTIDESSRELGAVSLDKYFWMQYNWRNVFKYSYFPFPSKWNETNTGSLYFQGIWTVIGILLTPILVFFSEKEKRKKIFILTVGTVIAFLLSLGSEGYIGYLLYQVKPYNMFRHAIKWVPFYQMLSVILAFSTIDSLVKLKLSQFCNVFIFLFLVQVPLYVYFIVTYDNAHSQRLTEVSLPIAFDRHHFDTNYRITGIWDKGEQYKSRYPEALLGYNFASFFGLYQIAGYEPMLPKKNMGHVRGNWFPGYYLNVNEFDLDHFIKYSLRWILIPQHQFENVKKILIERFPSIQLKSGPILNMSPKVRILEVLNATPMVSSNSAKVNLFYAKGNSIIAELTNIEESSRIIFSWVSNSNFHVYINKVEAPWEEDEFGRVALTLPKMDHAEIELKYYPQKVFLVNLVGYGLFLLGLCLVWPSLKPSEMKLNRD